MQLQMYVGPNGFDGFYGTNKCFYANMDTTVTKVEAHNKCPSRSWTIGGHRYDYANFAPKLKAVTTAFSNTNFWLDIKRAGKSCGIGLTPFIFDSSVNRC